MSSRKATCIIALASLFFWTSNACTMREEQASSLQRGALYFWGWNTSVIVPLDQSSVRNGAPTIGTLCDDRDLRNLYGLLSSHTFSIPFVEEEIDGRLYAEFARQDGSSETFYGDKFLTCQLEKNKCARTSENFLKSMADGIAQAALAPLDGDC